MGKIVFPWYPRVNPAAGQGIGHNGILRPDHKVVHRPYKQPAFPGRCGEAEQGIDR